MIKIEHTIINITTLANGKAKKRSYSTKYEGYYQAMNYLASEVNKVIANVATEVKITRGKEWRKLNVKDVNTNGTQKQS